MAKTFFPGPTGAQQKHTIPREDLRQPDGSSSCRGNLVSGHSTAILETRCPRGDGGGQYRAGQKDVGQGKTRARTQWWEGSPQAQGPPMRLA